MIIRSDRLIVHLDPPNMGWATGNRFDRTGAITSIVLDGKHTFTALENSNYRNKASGGYGLMADFHGFEFTDAAKPGERYHKAGVGLILRGDEDEVSFRTAIGADCVPYETSFTQESRSACSFRSEAPLHMGWAFLLRRRVEVIDNQIIMTAMLENTGKKPIHMREYNHNFLNLDGRPIGPDTKLTLTYDLTQENPPADFIKQNGREFTFDSIPEGQFYLFSDKLGGTDIYGWTLSNDKDSLSVSEQLSEKASRTQIWGRADVLSAEIFVPIDLPVGQSKTWTRTWRFEGA